MKRRFQFSVATLLAAVTACAFGAHWYAAKRYADAARYALAETQADCKGDEEVYSASVNLLHAQLAVPFADREGAFLQHLELMEKREKDWRMFPLISMVSDNHDEWVRECNEKADRVHVWVEEAERWLDEEY